MIGPVLVADICVRCIVEVGLGLDRKAVIVWLTPSASINCSRSSIFVLPLATVCCVHAVREKAFWECGVWEEVPERCYFVQENSTETESGNGWRRDELTNRENGVWCVNLTRKKNKKKKWKRKRISERQHPERESWVIWSRRGVTIYRYFNFYRFTISRHARLLMSSGNNGRER